MDDCIFCKIVQGRAPATRVAGWLSAIAIVPLNPVVDGHVIVLPRQHVEDFTSDPLITEYVMGRAAELAAQMRKPMNLITSKGKEATQSVFHLHVHLVPRAEGDGLLLPWSFQ